MAESKGLGSDTLPATNKTYRKIPITGRTSIRSRTPTLDI